MVDPVGNLHSPDSLEYPSQTVLTDDFCVTKRGDLFKHSYYLLESLQVSQPTSK